MKTNQIFNFNRFGKYAKNSLAINYKQTLMMWGVIVTSIFVISLFIMRSNGSNWNKEGWITLFLGIYFVAGIIYTGLSFPQFRSKEKTIMSLMVPVTPFERFFYEFIEKIASFILLYPTLFWVFSSLAVFVRNSFRINNEMTEVNGFRTFPFETISFQELNVFFPEGQVNLIFTLSILAFTLVFAGAATFRKYPLVKTIVFVGAVMGIYVGYLMLIFNKFQLRNPWISNLEHTMKAEQGFIIGSILLTILSLVSLAYAYFKLKEKEVS